MLQIYIPAPGWVRKQDLKNEKVGTRHKAMSNAFSDKIHKIIPGLYHWNSIYLNLRNNDFFREEACTIGGDKVVRHGNRFTGRDNDCQVKSRNPDTLEYRS